MSSEQRVSRINELYAQVKALQDSGRILHDNIFKTSKQALELIEQTLASRGLPSIEQSYQQLLQTLPENQAENIEKSLQQTFLDPGDGWMAPMRRLAKYLIYTDVGILTLPQVSKVHERFMGIWSQLSTASNAGASFADHKFGLLIGMARDLQANKEFLDGAIGIAKNVAPPAVVLIGALITTVTLGIAVKAGKYWYDSLKQEVQKEHDKATIQALVVDRLYARVRQRYLELINNQAGIMLSIGILMSNGLDPQVLVATIETTAAEAAKEVTGSVIHAYYQQEDERNRSWTGDDPSLEEIERFYSEKL